MSTAATSNLRMFSTQVTVLGGVGQITQGNFLSLQNRGKVVAIGLTVANNTIAEVDGVIATIKANGDEIYKVAPLIKYSPFFNQEKDREDIRIQDNTTIDYVFTNDQANPMVVYINLYYMPS